jgi:hypothetical protein
MTPQRRQLSGRANRNDLRQRRRSFGDAGWHKTETIPQRATKPSLIITAPDREKSGRDFSLSTPPRAHDNQPAVITDDMAN